MRLLLASALLIAACATHAPEPTPTASVIFQSERAFATRAGEVGWIPAFREFVAPDGYYLRPEIVNAPEHLAAAEDDGFKGLQWRPFFGAIARSGDFGYTTGPVFIEGRDGVRSHYFTVWRKQPDGSWKWVFDGGIRGVADPNPIAPDAVVPEAPVAARGVGSAATAIAQVQALETRVAAQGRDALIPYLASDARIDRTGQPFAVGRAASEALLRADPNYTLSAPLKMEASAAGDMAFTLGPAVWTDATGEKRAHYARIWQYQDGTWRIIFDELIPTSAVS